MKSQSDPGLRGGAPGAGGMLPGLTVKESKFANAGLDAFEETQSVSGTIAKTEPGLGPRFNSDSCVSCHSHPATGGSSPLVNPQVAVATKNGATNTIPSFITIDGPVREARFKSDGGVHALFTITGRIDASGCNIAQPNFDSANTVFRIPTPLFGLGLVQSILDSTILTNKMANGAAKALLGISGHENREGNAGTITRFGWKAQNKSLAIFSGEAYNVEQGVTNELFQQERDETPGCLFNPTPENLTNYEESQAQRLLGDVNNFANFMLFLAPPTPAPLSSSSSRGKAIFENTNPSNPSGVPFVGCALCHTPSMQTDKSYVAALDRKIANLYSDLLVHKMGSQLADGITQGAAAGDEFRTAPLWGIGQRKFFLHDGRTTSLLQAIQAHSDSDSEAHGVIGNFNGLSLPDKQAILDFLRSL